MYHSLPPRVKFVGDSGYGGKPNKILIKQVEHSHERQMFIEYVLSRHESVNKRITDFKILRNKFHDGKGADERMHLHKMGFQAILVLVQFEFKHGRPPFDA